MPHNEPVGAPSITGTRDGIEAPQGAVEGREEASGGHTDPVAELRAAAAKIRKLIADATPGPWQRPLNTRYKATVTGALPEGERGGFLDGIDPATGRREQCTVATIPIWSNGRHSRQRGGRDLEYIAAMHPGVGEALADWLDSAVVDAEQIGVDYRALAVARQINGTEATA